MKAFKDWSLIVHALGTGRQSIILRKGGIHEDSGSFEIESNEFLLLPTLFHQASDKVKETDGVDGTEYHKDHLSTVVKYFARLEKVFEINSAEQLDAIDSYHIWSKEVVRERFDRWNPNKVFCLLLRVYELEKPISIEMSPELGGCKSWVDIDVELTGNHRVVLAEESFFELSSLLDKTL